MIQGSQLGFAETISLALVAGAVWLLYLFLIFRRHTGKEVLLRSLLLAVALSCLCLIIVQPQYSFSRPGGKALLLTQPVSSMPDSLRVFALPGVSAPAHVQQVPDLGFIERNYPQIQELYIDGYGLEPAQMQALQRLQLHFLEKKAPAGFTWLGYSRKVNEGEELLISGTYGNASADTAKLILSTAEGLQDSVLLAPGENRFSLQAQTQVAGNYIAALRLVNGDSIRTEPLPYVVAEKQPLQVLMLQAFPSFEMNYLKDWLGQAKHRIQLRARISRDKFATQTINLDSKAGTQALLSEQNLKEANLLICDAESLRQFSAAERKRLQQAVEDGLGLLVLADEAWLKNPQVLGRKFPLIASEQLSFAPGENVQAAQGKVLAGKLPAAFAESSLQVPVAYSHAGEITAAYTPAGKGRTGALLATATFPWILQGETALYSRLWTDIIQAFSRREPGRAIRLADFPFMLKDHPVYFLVTDTALIPAAIRYASGTGQQAMPRGGLPQSVETSYQFLPVEEGWIQIGYKEDTTLSYQACVLPAHAWTDLKHATWWRQNGQYTYAGSADKAYTYAAWEEISPLWFFLPLITSLALLWWREKG
jgi:hypothetical protein